MTFEDFAESVLAGWLPLGWSAALHWLATHVWPLVAVLAARLRK